MDFNFANYLRKYGHDIPQDMVFKAAMKTKRSKKKLLEGDPNNCHQCKTVLTFCLIKYNYQRFADSK